MHKFFKSMFPPGVIRNINSFMSIGLRHHKCIFEGNFIHVRAGIDYKAKVIRAPYFNSNNDLMCDVKWEYGGSESVDVSLCSEIVHAGTLRNRKPVSEKLL